MKSHLKRIKRKPVKDKKGDFSMAKINIRKRQKLVSQFREIYIYDNEKEKNLSCTFFLLVKKKLTFKWES